MGAEVVVLGIAAAVSAFSSIRQGQAAKEAGDFNARQAEQNARLTTLQGAEDERRVRAMSAKQIGETRASIGANNLTLDGSPLDILQESAQNAERDALNIRVGASRRSQILQENAAMERRQGAGAQVTGYLSAAGQLGMGYANASRRYNDGSGSDELDLGD